HSEMLRPVRESYLTDRPIPWNRVYDVADFCYFNHSIHVQKGIGCVTCHGRVDRMQLLSKATSLHMEWCLNCHSNVERYIRPRELVFPRAGQPPADQLTLGRKLVEEYKIADKALLTSCSTCHR